MLARCVHRGQRVVQGGRSGRVRGRQCRRDGRVPTSVSNQHQNQHSAKHGTGHKKEETHRLIPQFPLQRRHFLPRQPPPPRQFPPRRMIQPEIIPIAHTRHLPIDTPPPEEPRRNTSSIREAAKVAAVNAHYGEDRAC